MKLLFDQNISYRIIKSLHNSFPDCSHVSQFGLLSASDIEIWNFSKQNSYCIVTFDYDFIDLSVLKGSPPKIIVLRTGNTKTEHLISFIESHQMGIKEFLADGELSFLELV